jgi:hypothetical protein
MDVRCACCGILEARKRGWQVAVENAAAKSLSGFVLREHGGAKRGLGIGIEP